jgi:hypothetical protein
MASEAAVRPTRHLAGEDRVIARLSTLDRFLPL